MSCLRLFLVFRVARQGADVSSDALRSARRKGHRKRAGSSEQATVLCTILYTTVHEQLG